MKRHIGIEIINHLFFWLIASYLFCSQSFIRIHPLHNEYEYYSLILLIILVYINYFLITPSYLTKNKILLYFIFTISAVLIATCIEFFIIKNDILFFISHENIKVQNGVLRWNFYGVFFRDALFVGFFTIYRIYRDAIKAYSLLQEKLELERLQFITQIDMIKSRINTHFFFNSLNSIYALVLSKSDKAAGILLKLSDLMEYVVKDSEKEWVTLDSEIKFLQNYIEVERILHNKMDLQFDIIGETIHQKVPPMIFESFVNNAFKYTDFDDNGYVKIKINSVKADIIFECKNTLYKSENTNIKSTGKGLRNTMNRLELHYKNKHHLDIINDENMYSVKLKLIN